MDNLRCKLLESLQKGTPCIWRVSEFKINIVLGIKIFKELIIKDTLSVASLSNEEINFNIFGAINWLQMGHKELAEEQFTNNNFTDSRNVTCYSLNICSLDFRHLAQSKHLLSHITWIESLSFEQKLQFATAITIVRSCFGFIVCLIIF